MNQIFGNPHFSRNQRNAFVALGGLVTTFLMTVGCARLAVNSQSPDEELLDVEESVAVVGDFASPNGLRRRKVESVVLLTNLKGTGSDPGPSVLRSKIVGDMRRRDVRDPGRVLASPNTSMALVTGYLRPGVEKGERFDVIVTLPVDSQTSSLRGGFVMLADMTELAMLGGRLREDRTLGRVEGAILVDPDADEKNNSGRLRRGLVLGGAVSNISRQIGLRLDVDELSLRESVTLSKNIGDAINARFHRNHLGRQEGVATPKKNDYIVLEIPEQYRNNLRRYLMVVNAIALGETHDERIYRLQSLERQLLRAETTIQAAIKLEAIGHGAISVLKKGVLSSDHLVRFHAAQALAYLDQQEAALPLSQLLKESPELRDDAFAALAAMHDVSAFEQLTGLLDHESLPIRYAAFNAISILVPDDPLVTGELLAKQFRYHVLKTDGKPMVHVSRNRRPEIVLFGHDQRITAPSYLESSSASLTDSITIHAKDSEHVIVARFSVDRPTQKRIVTSRLDDIIRAMVDLGADYEDVLRMLQRASAKKMLQGRFEVETFSKSR